MVRDDSVYLQHILDAIRRIEEYLRTADESMFMNNSLLQDGVIRQIEIIGEAVKRLSISVRTTNTEVPWSDIARMRDKLIHDYFGVDIEKVWLVTQDDIPVLKKNVEEIIKGL